MPRATAKSLSLESIVDAAVKISEREGVDALTMRSLAEACGVGVMTLYGYVRTKEELIGILADRFLGEIEMPAPTAPWREQVHSLFTSVRDVMLAHPAIVPILASQRIDGAAAYRGAEVVISALRNEGLSDRDVITSFAALSAFTVGSVQREIGIGLHGRANLPTLATLRPDEFPHVLALAGEFLARDPQAEFDNGLRLLIAGIAAAAVDAAAHDLQESR
jgi:AcrR family transcriptional regulator